LALFFAMIFGIFSGNICALSFSFLPSFLLAFLHSYLTRFWSGFFLSRIVLIRYFLTPIPPELVGSGSGLGFWSLFSEFYWPIFGGKIHINRF
jgi:hypothetical protein